MASVDLPEILKELIEEKVVIYSSKGIEEIKLLNSLEEIWRGAEALIFRARLLDLDVVIKWRFPKPYMPRELDSQFRYNRTVIEVRALLKALSKGVLVPIPIFVDPYEGIIISTYIRGSILRDIASILDREELCRICRTIGKYAAILHREHLVHGDLTTGNVIVDDQGNVYLIDFGLADFSSRLEDHAIDIHIYFRSIESSHSDREPVMKNCFIEGYREIRGSVTDQVLRLVDDIRRRGRYVAERKLSAEWRF